MKYYVDNDGIHLEIDRPIPDAEAVRAVQAIAAKQREALDAIRPNDAAATVDTGTQAAQRPAAAA
jgi:hypothetical protein